MEDGCLRRRASKGENEREAECEWVLRTVLDEQRHLTSPLRLYKPLSLCPCCYDFLFFYLILSLKNKKTTTFARVFSSVEWILNEAQRVGLLSLFSYNMLPAHTSRFLQKADWEQGCWSAFWCLCPDGRCERSQLGVPMLRPWDWVIYTPQRHPKGTFSYFIFTMMNWKGRGAAEKELLCRRWKTIPRQPSSLCASVAGVSVLCTCVTLTWTGQCHCALLTLSLRGFIHQRLPPFFPAFSPSSLRKVYGFSNELCSYQAPNSRRTSFTDMGLFYSSLSNHPSLWCPLSLRANVRGLGANSRITTGSRENWIWSMMCRKIIIIIFFYNSCFSGHGPYTCYLHTLGGFVSPNPLRLQIPYTARIQRAL